MAFELFQIYLIGLVFLIGALAIGDSVSWLKDESFSDSRLLGIPLFLLLAALVGALITVGLKSSVVLLSLPLLVFLFWHSDLKLNFNLQFSLFNWLIIGVFHLFWVLQVWPICDFQNNSFRLTHHDDYSYINLVNLIQQTGEEGLFTELNRVVHGLDGNYHFYHYFEFYLICLIQKIGGLANYQNYHFFLVPVLQVLAFSQFVKFVRIKTQLSPWVLFAFSLFLFTSLRYTCVDEWVNSILKWSYFKGVFFQNYSYPHPLSFFFGYKLCLAFLFVLPVLESLEKKHLLRSLFFVGLSSVVSLALMPFVLGSFLLYLFSKFINPKLAFYLAFASLFCSLTLFWSPGFSVEFLPSQVSGRIQKLVNLFFENYYLVISAAAIVLIFGSRLQRKELLVGIPLFPLVYLAHGLLFKIFLLYLIFLVGYFLSRCHQRPAWSFVFKPQNSVMMGLFAIVPVFSGIADFGQIFFNLVLLLLLVFLLDCVSTSKIKLSDSVGSIFFGMFLLLNLPAIRFDRSMPLKDQRIPNLDYFQPTSSNGPIRILSVARYKHLPYLYHDIVGNALLNRFNHVFISPGGLEFLDSSGIENVKNSGHWPYIQRIPYFEFIQSHPAPPAVSLRNYVNEFSIDAVCVENDTLFSEYVSLIQPMIKRRIRVEDGNYQILLLKETNAKTGRWEF